MRTERKQRKQTIKMSHEHFTGTLKSPITQLITVFINELFLD